VLGQSLELRVGARSDEDGGIPRCERPAPFTFQRAGDNGRPAATVPPGDGAIDELHQRVGKTDRDLLAHPNTVPFWYENSGAPAPAGPDRRDPRTVSRAVEESNRRLLRARDAMDRGYAQPLDIPRLARVSHVSEAHFIRTFRATFGETPHRYLQRRRVERSMFLLRETDSTVTEICFEVGFASVGTFSRTFREIVGEPPTAYRHRADVSAVPNCFAMAWTRPSSFGEADRRDGG